MSVVVELDGLGDGSCTTFFVDVQVDGSGTRDVGVLVGPVLAV